jgi:hypothetical protein
MSDLIKYPDQELDDCEWLDDLLQPPESRSGREILIPEVPPEWLDWPCHIEVSFTLTDYTCVYDALYKEYEVADLKTATQKLFAPKNKQIFVRYRAHTVGIAPLYAWDVSWPLLRKGSEEHIVNSEKRQGTASREGWEDGIAKSENRQGAAPWVWYYDDTLFEIWNQPIEDRYYEGRLMLRARGRSKEDAVENWKLIAKPMRKIYKEINGK